MTGVLRELSAVVTSRYHAAVLSMERGCPVAAVSMDERLDSLMKELAFEQDHLLHVNDAELGRRLYRMLMNADAQREATREKIFLYTDEKKQELERMGVFMKEYLEKKPMMK